MRMKKAWAGLSKADAETLEAAGATCKAALPGVEQVMSAAGCT
jgi:hypothetical protein